MLAMIPNITIFTVCFNNLFFDKKRTYYTIYNK